MCFWLISMCKSSGTQDHPARKKMLVKCMFYNHSGGQNKTEICIWNTWECIQSQNCCNSSHRTKSYFFCFHLWLVRHPGAERPQPGKSFPSPLWFIQYLANLALNLPSETSIHFSPPLPEYVEYMPPCLVSIRICFSLAFTSPLREWETGC